MIIELILRILEGYDPKALDARYVDLILNFAWTMFS